MYVCTCIRRKLNIYIEMLIYDCSEVMIHIELDINYIYVYIKS